MMVVFAAGWKGASRSEARSVAKPLWALPRFWAKREDDGMKSGLEGESVGTRQGTGDRTTDE